MPENYEQRRSLLDASCLDPTEFQSISAAGFEGAARAPQGARAVSSCFRTRSSTRTEALDRREPAERNKEVRDSDEEDDEDDEDDEDEEYKNNEDTEENDEDSFDDQETLRLSPSDYGEESNLKSKYSQGSALNGLPHTVKEARKEAKRDAYTSAGHAAAPPAKLPSLSVSSPAFKEAAFVAPHGQRAAFSPAAAAAHSTSSILGRGASFAPVAAAAHSATVVGDVLSRAKLMATVLTANNNPDAAVVLQMVDVILSYARADMSLNAAVTMTSSQQAGGAQPTGTGNLSKLRQSPAYLSSIRYHLC